MYPSLQKTLPDLVRNQSGLAMVEFAMAFPFFAALTIGGIEIANYASVVMTVNQITLHAADNAARMGSNTPDGNRQISEKHINDVFQGAMREGASISLEAKARVIMSSFEEVDPFVESAPRYRIRWQRCDGDKTSYKSNYGDPKSATSVTGIGRAGRQVSPPPGGTLMFVEVQYNYTPMLVNGFTRITSHTINQIASMVVRDGRDLTGASSGTGIYNFEKVDAATC